MNESRRCARCKGDRPVCYCVQKLQQLDVLRAEILLTLGRLNTQLQQLMTEFEGVPSEIGYYWGDARTAWKRSVEVRAWVDQACSSAEKALEESPEEGNRMPANAWDPGDEQ